MDVGAIDGLSFKVSHHAEHCQRGWPTSLSTGGRGGCLKVDWRIEGSLCESGMPAIRSGVDIRIRRVESDETLQL